MRKIRKFPLHFGFATMKKACGNNWIACEKWLKPTKKDYYIKCNFDTCQQRLLVFHNIFSLYLEKATNVSVTQTERIQYIFLLIFVFFFFFSLSLLSEAIDLNLCQLIIVTVCVCVAAPKAIAVAIA